MAPMDPAASLTGSPSGGLGSLKRLPRSIVDKRRRRKTLEKDEAPPARREAERRDSGKVLTESVLPTTTPSWASAAPSDTAVYDGGDTPYDDGNSGGRQQQQHGRRGGAHDSMGHPGPGDQRQPGHSRRIRIADHPDESKRKATAVADINGAAAAGRQRDGDDDSGSSASTEIGDVDDDRYRPSPISTRPSQIGYLTTSSPIVQATHLPEPLSLEVRPEPTDLELAPSTVKTLPPDRSGSVESDSRSSLSSRSKSSLLPPKKDARRSPSPVGSRIRGVFKTKRASSATPSDDGSSAGVSPERKNPAATSRDDRIFDGNPSSDSIVTTEISAQPNSRPATSSSDKKKPTLPPLTRPDTHAPDTVGSQSPERKSAASRASQASASGRPPATPPDSGIPGPIIVNTPPTPTDSTRPSETFSASSSPQAQPSKPRGSADSPNSSSSPWGTLTSYKRGRAGSAGPSKLSNTTFAPLTPTIESPPTDGTTAAIGNSPSSGFFSSMISAAQSAANQFSSTIQNNNTSGPKNRSGQDTSRPSTADQVSIIAEDVSQVEVEPFPNAEETNMEGKEPAVKTLGQGDLTLNHLGIIDSPSNAGTPITAKFAASDASGSETRTRSESAPADASPAVSQGNGFDDDFRGGAAQRPPSYTSRIAGDRTPPPASLYEEKTGPGIDRTGSMRSNMGPRHRARNSSTTTRGTSTTIGAAIAAANSSITNPAVSAPGGGPQQRLTGFAVASKKRNRDFHGLFKSVPDDDYLIEDYSCALQREILAHGRLYVSEGHLCFSSNILGWSTTLVMSFDEIVSVEKRSTALLFKNGLMISTLHAKHVFASFTSRDSTYDLIVNIWKLGHPTLKSSLNGVQLEGTGGDKTEKVDGDEDIADVSQLDQDDQSGSGSEDDSDDDDDVYDEDDDASLEPTQATDANGDSDPDKMVSKKPSAAVGGSNGGPIDLAREAGPPVAVDDFPGPATHAPTDCGDASNHYEKVVGDDVIPAPLGKVYNLMFGPASVTFMSKWLKTEAKCWDLVMEDKKGLTNDNKTREVTYVKPLPGSIGPKQTKCITAETVESLDLEKAVTINCSTQTPDVPSGNAFIIKTKYCLSWAENNSTRIQANCMVEWTAKSWLKGPITNGANDGQTQYCNELFASLKAAVSARPRSGTGSNRGGGKKKKGKKNRNATAAAEAEGLKKNTKSAQAQNWGPFEALRPVLGPVADILGPVLTGNVMYGLLVGLLVAAWLGYGFPSNRNAQVMGPYGYADRMAVDRIAAYEEMWRREETELWDWLEERVSLERLNENRAPTKRKPVEPRTVEEKVREERMDDREIEEAIRITEEKLHVLKGVMGKKKEEERAKAAAGAGRTSVTEST